MRNLISRLFSLFVLLFVAISCTDSSLIPVAGFWNGGFDGSPSDPNVVMKPEWKYRGFLQLYVTDMKFKMHLESEVQIVDVTGTWEKKKNKIYVIPKDVQFDDKGGRLLQKPGVTPLDPDVVKKACSQELVFAYTDNPQELKGLEITFGPMLGRFDFSKGRE